MQTNCIAHVMFSEAIKQAQELDDYFGTTGNLKGPLHGLPISVKEHIFLKGTPATSGLVAWKDNISEDDALIVKIFREAGAIFHVKTTNPQTLMSLETNSNLYGRTLNPHNRNLTSGGSSGGESALIAMRGSVLGIGTDIGESVDQASAHDAQLTSRLQAAPFVSQVPSQEDTVSKVVSPAFRTAVLVDSMRMFPNNYLIILK